MPCLTAFETKFEADYATLELAYQAAKLRLQAAQQEKLEAAAEFLSIRAALRQRLETLWPAPCPSGEQLGHHGDTDQPWESPAAAEEVPSRQAGFAGR